MGLIEGQGPVKILFKLVYADIEKENNLLIGEDFDWDWILEDLGGCGEPEIEISI